MNLYLLIGILGSITPIFDRYIVPKYDLNNLLFVRETVYALFLAILMFINKSTNIPIKYLYESKLSKRCLKNSMLFIGIYE